MPQQIFFTHNWNLTRHFRVVVCFLVGLLVCVLCGLFLLVLGFAFVLRFCSFERDQGIGLCIGPLPVAFCGPTAWPLRELINQSHMQHDWTHVERPGESHTALEGKK